MATKLLIVDDEVQAVELLTDYLTRKGYDVRVASTGQKALDIGVAYKPDVLIVDYILEDYPGTEVAKRLREHCPNTGILVMTGLPTYEIEQAAAYLDRVEIRMKPVGLDEVLSLVEALSPREERDGEATGSHAHDAKAKDSETKDSETRRQAGAGYGVGREQREA